MNLLMDSRVDVAVVTEAKLPSAQFSIDGYSSFFPCSPLERTGKFRVVVFVRASLASSTNARLRRYLMSDSTQSVWIKLDDVGTAPPPQHRPLLPHAGG
jgi:hypothetical protein